MARRPKEVPQTLHLVPPLVRYLRARGGDVPRLVRRLSLPEDVEAQDAAAITTGGFNALLEEIARQLGDPFICLRLPGEIERRTYNVWELLAGSSATLRDALARVARSTAATRAS